MRAAFSGIEARRDLGSVEAAWRALMPASFATPYQAFDFLKAWAEHAAPAEGVSPLIVVAKDADGPVALLPFGLKRRFGLSVASFLGGTHVNYNVPIIRHDALDRFTPTEVERLLKEAAGVVGIDAYALVNQPVSWQGAANPMSALSTQPSPDPAFSGGLETDVDAHFRKILSAKGRSKQRRKMRRFEELGATRLYRAETGQDRARLLQTYLDQKRAQLASRGIASAFDREGVAAFLAEACRVDGSENPAVELCAFELEGDPIAITGALPRGDRLSCMFNSIAGGEITKYSPGELLLAFVVEDAIKRGFRTFDLGAGVSPYKRMYCPDVEQLGDTILGVTWSGRGYAAVLKAMRGAKTRIKSSPAAYGLIEKARRLKAGKNGASEEQTDD